MIQERYGFLLCWFSNFLLSLSRWKDSHGTQSIVIWGQKVLLQSSFWNMLTGCILEQFPVRHLLSKDDSLIMDFECRKAVVVAWLKWSLSLTSISSTAAAAQKRQMVKWAFSVTDGNTSSTSFGPVVLPGFNTMMVFLRLATSWSRLPWWYDHHPPDSGQPIPSLSFSVLWK